jgi:pimeloyl-ACP methyl ester carboxylesterase
LKRKWGEPMSIVSNREPASGSPIAPIVSIDYSRPWLSSHDLSLPNGHRFRVWVAGERGIPFVLAPGFTASGKVYAQTACRLVALGFKPIIIDAPGHGGTEPLLSRRSRMSAEAYGEYYSAVLDHLGIRRAVLSGHSWGGLNAGLATAANPERVLALLLINSIFSVEWERWMAKLTLRPHRLPGFMTDFLLDGLYTIPFGDIQSGQMVKFTRTMGDVYTAQMRQFLRLSPPGLAIAIHRGQEAALDSIRRSGVPVIVLHGNRDRIVREACSLDTARRTGGYFIRIEGGCHAWLISCPNTFPAILAELSSSVLSDRLASVSPAECYEPDGLIHRLEVAPDKRRRRRIEPPRYQWTGCNL